MPQLCSPKKAVRESPGYVSYNYERTFQRKDLPNFLSDQRDKRVSKTREWSGGPFPAAGEGNKKSSTVPRFVSWAIPLQQTDKKPQSYRPVQGGGVSIRPQTFQTAQRFYLDKKC
ncbi:hypothetical protein TNIN_137881 [Trichonephila inaurata madagascariensis]|uniref:Uncharacterized protein n=1 Tax=Trichonephila inaurata madagascariensis TaxID=2747483 RepID=A0A8X6XZS8_9ARAC|nr:hypothetical protein TNIN_137881 [Trichonephila inaurata madagascariensis]